MGRSAVLLTILAVALGGCGEPRSRAADPHRTRWDGLCARLRPCHAAQPQASAPEVSSEERALLARVAGSSATAVVHIRTVLNAAIPFACQTDEPRRASLDSGGTGVVIAPEGLILTSAHVVRDAIRVQVVLPDGTYAVVHRVALDERLDLAVLRVAARGLPTLWPAATDVAVGTPVVALGRVAPAGPRLCRIGVVTDANASLQSELDPTRTCCYEHLVESSTVLEPGFSGGPLLDARGRLVGLNVAMAGAPSTRRGFALPLTADVRPAVQRMARAAAR